MARPNECVFGEYWGEVDMLAAIFGLISFLCYNMVMWITTLHRRAKQLDYWDLKMMALSMLCLGFVLGRIVPELLDVNPWWWATVFFLLILRPAYHFWISPSTK